MGIFDRIITRENGKKSEEDFIKELQVHAQVRLSENTKISPAPNYGGKFMEDAYFKNLENVVNQEEAKEAVAPENLPVEIEKRSNWLKLEDSNDPGFLNDQETYKNPATGEYFYPKQNTIYNPEINETKINNEGLQYGFNFEQKNLNNQKIQELFEKGDKYLENASITNLKISEEELNLLKTIPNSEDYLDNLEKDGDKYKISREDCLQLRELFEESKNEDQDSNNEEILDLESSKTNPENSISAEKEKLSKEDLTDEEVESGAENDYQSVSNTFKILKLERQIEAKKGEEVPEFLEEKSEIEKFKNEIIKLEEEKTKLEHINSIHVHMLESQDIVKEKSRISDRFTSLINEIKNETDKIDRELGGKRTIVTKKEAELAQKVGQFEIDKNNFINNANKEIEDLKTKIKETGADYENLLNICLSLVTMKRGTKEKAKAAAKEKGIDLKRILEEIKSEELETENKSEKLKNGKRFFESLVDSGKDKVKSFLDAISSKVAFWKKGQEAAEKKSGKKVGIISSILSIVAVAGFFSAKDPESNNPKPLEKAPISAKIPDAEKEAGTGISSFKIPVNVNGKIETSEVKKNNGESFTGKEMEVLTELGITSILNEENNYQPYKTPDKLIVENPTNKKIEGNYTIKNGDTMIEIIKKFLNNTNKDLWIDILKVSEQKIQEQNEKNGTNLSVENPQNVRQVVDSLLTEISNKIATKENIKLEQYKTEDGKIGFKAYLKPGSTISNQAIFDATVNFLKEAKKTNQ